MKDVNDPHGHRDVEKFPTVFGPPRGKVVCYGNVGLSRSRKHGRLKMLAAESRVRDEDWRRDAMQRLPPWARRLIGGMGFAT